VMPVPGSGKILLLRDAKGSYRRPYLHSLWN
jgi:hypothetical protein